MVRKTRYHTLKDFFIVLSISDREQILDWIDQLDELKVDLLNKLLDDAYSRGELGIAFERTNSDTM